MISHRSRNPAIFVSIRCARSLVNHSKVEWDHNLNRLKGCKAYVLPLHLRGVVAGVVVEVASRVGEDVAGLEESRGHVSERR